MLTYIYVCLILLVAGYAFAEPPTIGSIDRSQEMIRDDEALRRKVEQGEKFFVKKVILKGNLKLSPQEAEDLKAPFQNRWLTKEDILGLIDSLKPVAGSANLSYELKKDGVLEITAGIIDGL